LEVALSTTAYEKGGREGRKYPFKERGGATSYGHLFCPPAVPKK